MLLIHWLSNLRLRLNPGLYRRCRNVQRYKNYQVIPIAAEVQQLETRWMLSTITVTSLADTLNAGAAGGVTLRDAIQAANADTSVDGSAAGQANVQSLIAFQPGLTGKITLTNGQLEITSTMEIEGLGATNTIIDAQQNSRIFDITSTAGAVTVDGITLENGRTTDSGNPDVFNHPGAGVGDGGAIRDMSAGELTVTNSTLSGNSVSGKWAKGGAIYSVATVALTNATLSENSTSGYGGFGGAVEAYTLTVANSNAFANLTSGTDAYGGAIAAINSATITNSSLFENSTSGSGSFGGAIVTLRLTVANSSISANSTSGAFAPGGAIFATYIATIANSILSGNSTTGADSNGGAIKAATTVAVLDSTVTGNFTSGPQAGGGAIYSSTAFNYGTATVTNSTVSGNFTTGTGAGGGAIVSNTLTIANSTLSGNSTTGTDANGGAIVFSSLRPGTLTAINSTISQNHAENAIAGGIWSGWFSIATISNTIVAENSDDGAAPDWSRGRNDISLNLSHSLIGDNKGMGIPNPAVIGQADANGNLIGTDLSKFDPLLGPLADNGGAVQTMALLPGSQAIDAGSIALAIDPTTNLALTTDERGQPYVRNFGTAVDMGAFESQTLNLVVTSAADRLDASYDPANLTLRDALTLVNADDRASGQDTIRFNIGSGPQTITLASALPAITHSVVIDGTTQPGYTGIPLIFIGGHNEPTGQAGLYLAGGNSVVKGLDVSRVNGVGIWIEGGTGSQLIGDFVGTDATGEIGQGNAYQGVYVHNATNTLILDNVIAGNGNNGLWLDGSSESTLQGNMIGVDREGSSAIPNSFSGILISVGSSNLVGGDLPSDGNVIAANAGGGVNILSGTGNTIRHNSIFGNGGLGIDLNGDGVTGNHAGGAVPGPNGLQNYPLLSFANTSDDSNLT